MNTNTPKTGNLSRRSFLQGALVGSAGIAALGLMGLNLTACSPSKTEDGQSTAADTVDVIVVGGGLGGLKAALTAAEQGKSVILFEKLSMLGGNSSLSDGTLHAAGTQLQKEQNIDSGNDTSYAQERLDSQSPYKDSPKPLVMALYQGAREMIDELSGQGVEFEPIPARDIWAHNTVGHGALLVSHVKGLLDKTKADVRLSTSVTSLLVEDGKVVGVASSKGNKSSEHRAKAVILATGGYCSGQELVDKYSPKFSDVFVMGSPGAEGDGLTMGQDVGAADFGMDLGLHTFIVNAGFPRELTVPMVTTPGIFVNIEGKRCLSEDSHYDKMGKLCLAQPEHRGYFIFGEASLKDYPLLTSFCIDAGITTAYNSLDELAAGIKAPGVVATIEQYNAMVEQGADTDFGRKGPLEKLEGPKYYAVDGETCRYFSYGGLDVDTEARVLDKSGEAIEGLYACGEAMASPEVREGLIYTSGLSAAYAFGNIAAKTAIADLKS